jgi:hypothetical protein
MAPELDQPCKPKLALAPDQSRGCDAAITAQQDPP